MKFGIYILLYNRLDTEHVTETIINIIESKSFKNELVNLIIVDDSSSLKFFKQKFEILKDKFQNKGVKFVTNKKNQNIIQNPINIFHNSNEDYIAFLADDDSIESYHVDNYVDSIINNNDHQISCFVNDFNEIAENKIIFSWKLREFMSNSAFYRCLSFLFNQSDMYLYGFYSTKSLKKYKFYGFTFFKKSPTSWAYTLPFFVLLSGKIKNLGIEKSWKYNSKSEKHYLEYNESSKFLWYIKYILRELDLHFLYIRYLPVNLFSIFIIILMPIVFFHKNLTRIFKSKINNEKF